MHLCTQLCPRSYTHARHMCIYNRTKINTLSIISYLTGQALFIILLIFSLKWFVFLPTDPNLSYVAVGLLESLKSLTMFFHCNLIKGYLRGQGLSTTMIPMLRGPSLISRRFPTF